MDLVNALYIYGGLQSVQLLDTLPDPTEEEVIKCTRLCKS